MLLARKALFLFIILILECIPMHHPINLVSLNKFSMKKISLSLFVFFFLMSCSQKKPVGISEVTVTTLYTDSISIRAIAPGKGKVTFAANNGIYGVYDSLSGNTKVNKKLYDTIVPAFRAVAVTNNDFFMLSIASPALLYKSGANDAMDLVYKEEGEGVFYDSMQFWNDKEGIAMGDPVDGCLSVIITRDGGKTWQKQLCIQLPVTFEGEAAFAASNSNIAMYDDYTWIATGGVKSRILYSADKGENWEVIETPFIQGTPTQGMYSIDFYDAKNGFAIGGDYTKPDANKFNKAVTSDGGKTWKVVANGELPGYKSCVQYVPGSHAKSLVAVGFTGIAASNDGGKTWKQLSKEGFYTLRFVNEFTAYAAGKGRLARLEFK